MPWRAILADSCARVACEPSSSIEPAEETNTRRVPATGHGHSSTTTLGSTTWQHTAGEAATSVQESSTTRGEQGGMVCGLTFDMRGGRKQAKLACGRPLDGRVRAHSPPTPRSRRLLLRALLFETRSHWSWSDPNECSEARPSPRQGLLTFEGVPLRQLREPHPHSCRLLATALRTSMRSSDLVRSEALLRRERSEDRRDA